MIIDVPAVPAIDPANSSNMPSVYLSVLIKQLKQVQREVFADIRPFHYGVSFDAFKTQVTEQKCHSNSDPILLQKVQDDACIRQEDEFISNVKFSRPRCDPVKIKASNDVLRVQPSIDEKTVFKIEDQCFLNRPPLSSCPTFASFLPIATECSFIEVLEENCIYDVKINQKNYTVTVQKNVDVGFKLRVVDTLSITSDFNKPRRIDLKALEETPKYYEIHEVEAYRGPCIFKDFTESSHQVAGTRCKVTYASHFKSTPPMLYNDADSADRVGAFKCGLKAYLKARLGKSKITTSQLLDAAVDIGNVLPNSSERDPSIPTSSTLYSKAKNMAEKKPDATIASYGLHEKDALHTLKHTLKRHLNPDDDEYKVVHNTDFYKMEFSDGNNTKFGGTPDGFVFKKKADNTYELYATIEAKCHNPPNRPFYDTVPERVRLQAFSHVAIMNSLLTNPTIQKCFVVSWTPKESRIFEFSIPLNNLLNDNIKKIVSNIASNTVSDLQKIFELPESQKILTVNSVQYYKDQLSHTCLMRAKDEAGTVQVPISEANRRFTSDSKLDNNLTNVTQNDRAYELPKTSKVDVSNEKESPYISLTDSYGTRVQFTKLRMKDFKFVVENFENFSAEEIFLHMFKDVFSEKPGDFNVLSNDSGGKCYDYQMLSKFLLVSKPLFKNKQDVDDYVIEDDKTNELVYIKKHGIRYIVPRAPTPTTSVVDPNLTTTSVVQLTEGVYIYNFIIQSDDIEFCLMLNVNVEYRITTLIKLEEKFDRVFWMTLFYFIGLLDEHKVTMNISKLKVTDKPNALHNLKLSYWNYENQRKQEHVRIKYTGGQDRIKILKVVASCANKRPEIMFATKHIRMAIRHAIIL